MSTIPSFADKLSEVIGDRPVVKQQATYRTTVYTYDELLNQSKRFATYLRDQGVRRGDRVIIQGPNHPAWIVAFTAAAYVGAVVVPLDEGSSDRFEQQVQAETDPAMIIGDGQNGASFDTVLSVDREKARPADIAPGDLLQILYTSGTTSEPKGVRITHRNIVGNIRQLRKALTFPEKQVFLSVLPLSHAFEQVIGFFLPVRFGNAVVFPRSRRSKSLQRAFQDQGVTTMVCVPAFLASLKQSILSQTWMKSEFFERLAGLPEPVRSPITARIRSRIAPDLETVIVGGASLDETVERFWKGLGVTVLQGYGLTETSPVITCNRFDDAMVGSAGVALPEQEIRLGEDNEIQVRGPNVTSGYYERPEATDAAFTDDGYFKTGDVGRFDDDHLYVTGRLKNMIVTSSGMNVYPEDIEEELRKHDNVADAVVVEKDEALVGVVTGDVEKPTSIQRSVNQELSSHQRLADVMVWPGEDYPRTRTHKVRRDQVQDWVSDGRIDDREAETGVEALLVEHGSRNPDDVDGDEPIVEAYGIDSVSRIALLDAVEASYNVELDETVLDATTTLATFKEAVQKGDASRHLERVGRWTEQTRTGMAAQTVLLQCLRARLDVEVKGSVPDETVVFAANHNSHLDTPLLLAALPRSVRGRVSVAGAKDYFFTNPVISWFARRALQVYPFDRQHDPRRSLLRTGRLLDKERSVAVFPEGTRGEPGVMSSFEQGIGVIGVDMDATIIPVGITGTDKALPKGSWLPRHEEITVCFGDPIRFEQESYEEATKRVEDRVRDLV